MCCRRPLLLPLLLLGAACLAAGSPATLSRHRRASPFNSISGDAGGIPLTALFARCGATAEDDDIGPCLAELLRGAIDKARPSFSTGLDIGRDNIVLEPLDLDDIEPKREKSFQVSVRDLQVHGISTLDINNITFSSSELALNLTFSKVAATGKVKLTYLFLSATPEVELMLSNLTVLVRAKWVLDINPRDPTRLDIVLHDATAQFDVGGLDVDLGNFGNVGIFLQNFIRNNEQVLVSFLVPTLEKSITKKLNKKLNRIKIAD